MKSTRLIAAALVAVVALLAQSSRLTAATAVPGCGDGLQLILDPGLEAALAAATQGNVNGDGYVCVRGIGRPGGYIVVIDNTVGGSN
jgi:hypothetical protein